MRILVLNPNTSAATTSAMVELVAEALPEAAVEGFTAPFGEPMIVTDAALATGARAVAAMGEGIADGIDGVIVAAFGDPGIDALRARLSCPVAGIGEAAFREAGAEGRRFGVATTTPGLVAAISARVAAAGLSAGFSGTRLTPGDPAALVADPDRLVAALALAVRACIADGAGAVIIGGGPLARAARTLAPMFDVPIIEPVPAAARLIRARIIGHGSVGQAGVGQGGVGKAGG